MKAVGEEEKKGGIDKGGLTKVERRDSRIKRKQENNIEEQG